LERIHVPVDLQELIRLGEGPQLEFKSSLRFDYRENKVNRELERVVAKSIAGFLNSNGGTLLIGIADQGNVVGIQRDIDSLSNKSLDAFERALRTAIGKYLGADVSADIFVDFPETDGLKIARVKCDKHPEAVYLRDGDRYEFYVRDGNATRPLNILEANKYIERHFSRGKAVYPDLVAVVQEIKDVLAQTRGTRSISTEMLDSLGGPTAVPEIDATAITTAQSDDASEPVHLPPWLRVYTRYVLNGFLRSLANAPEWKRIYIISPWLSRLDDSFALSSEALAKRFQEDNATVYLVTRPPVEEWHETAIQVLAETQRVNIATVPDLHTKLYTASTAAGSFALLGSANFTQRAHVGREIGLLVNSFMGGKRLFSTLDREAADIYRTPSRTLIKQARF
jgi:hypothetical protein